MSTEIQVKIQLERRDNNHTIYLLFWNNIAMHRWIINDDELFKRGWHLPIAHRRKWDELIDTLHIDFDEKLEATRKYIILIQEQFKLKDGDGRG